MRINHHFSLANDNLSMKNSKYIFFDDEGGVGYKNISLIII